MKNSLCIIVYAAVLFFPQILFAQNATPKQQVEAASKPQSSFFVELGGQSIIYSVNGDFRLSGTKNNLGIRAGIGYLNIDNESLTTIPIGLNYLMGKKNKYFEVGLGATFVSSDALKSSTDNGLLTVGTIFFGYRLQPEDGGFNFRVGLPLIFYNDGQDSFFIPFYPGISFGYTFE